MGFSTMSGIPKVTSTAHFYSNTNPLLQSRGIGGFTQPSALFGSGEQGAWWDFSDLSVMFQDSAGTVPAALESPVGKVLDKSGKNNHLVQPTAGARPTLSRRYNWVTSTRDYSGWTVGGGITTAAQSNALNTDTATRVTYAGAVGTAADSRFEILTSPIPGGTASQPFTETVYIKSANSNPQTCRIKLTQSGVIDNFSANLNITTAWQPFTFAVTNTAAVGNSRMLCGIAADTGNNAFDVLVSRFDCRLTADVALAIPSYQWVDTASSYDTLGFPAYLLFDGATKSLVPVAIPLGATTNSTVIVGVQVNTGGSNDQGIYAERDNTIGGNINGQLDFTTAGTPRYAVRGAGGIAAPVGTAPGTTTTNVFTGTYDGATAKIRTNGAEVGTASATVGVIAVTAPSVGREDTAVGGTNFFNGRMYGIIVRGAVTNANDLQMTEKWMGSKCGKFF